jgi:DNA polymerase-3 subunit delta'
VSLRFSSIIGHGPIVRLLSRAVARGTLPPTLLLAGPAGVGKWRVARTVAAAINCLTPQRLERGDYPIDACGSCRACDRIARGVHVDVVDVEPDERASIKIDVVRDVLERAAYRPFEGRRRVVLVREADTLEPQAQNALLKSLEEPPPGTVFILTTAVPGALLPTVRSRAMRLAFGRLSEPEVVRVLVDRHGYHEDDARAAAVLADGSAGQALALGSVDLGAIHEMALLLLNQAVVGEGASNRLQAASTLIGSAKEERARETLALILRMLASMLRDLELLNAGGDRRALANPGLAADLARLQSAFGGARAREAFGAVDQAIMALERNAGPKVVADWVSLRL